MLNHSLVLAMLVVYGFSTSSFKLMQIYQCNRFAKTKINDSFTDYIEILVGVPQGFILGTLPFKIFLNDIFLLIINSSLCNYADGLNKNLHVVKSNLEANFATMQK